MWVYTADDFSEEELQRTTFGIKFKDAEVRVHCGGLPGGGGVGGGGGLIGIATQRLRAKVTIPLPSLAR
jgi:hypothetical protein